MEETLNMNTAPEKDLSEELLSKALAAGSISQEDIIAAGKAYADDTEGFRSFLKQLWREDILLTLPEWSVRDKKAANGIAEKLREDYPEEKAAYSGSEDAAGLYLAELGEITPITSEVEKTLIYQALDEGTDITEELLERSLYLSAWTALKFVGKGILFTDLVQEGNVLLTELAYDLVLDEPYSFTAFALAMLHKHMQALTEVQEDIISIPQGIAEEFAKLRTSAAQFREKEGRSPTTEELAGLVHMSQKEISDLLSSAAGVIPEKTPPAAKSDAEKAEDQLSRQVRELLAALPEKEAAVLSMKYGIGRKAMSVEEIAMKLHLSREEVLLAEQEAMRLLGR